MTHYGIIIMILRRPWPICLGSSKRKKNWLRHRRGRLARQQVGYVFLSSEKVLVICCWAAYGGKDVVFDRWRWVLSLYQIVEGKLEWML